MATNVREANPIQIKLNDVMDASSHLTGFRDKTDPWYGSYVFNPWATYYKSNAFWDGRPDSFCKGFDFLCIPLQGDRHAGHLRGVFIEELNQRVFWHSRPEPRDFPGPHCESDGHHEKSEFVLVFRITAADSGLSVLWTAAQAK